MVDAARHAVKRNGHLKERFQKLDKRIGRPKALVVMARKLLIVVWHILTKEEAEWFVAEHRLPYSIFAMAFKVGASNLPEGQSTRLFVSNQLDRLGIGKYLGVIHRGKKRSKLSPSTLMG